MHIGSQITALEPFDAAFARLGDLVQTLRADGHQIEHVDLGGGLGIQILGGVRPVFAFEYLVIFLIVVAVGGLGNIRGAFFAALILGITDFAGKYWFPEGGAFVIYAVTIIVLLWRPQGLFGRV